MIYNFCRYKMLGNFFITELSDKTISSNLNYVHMTLIKNIYGSYLILFLLNLLEDKIKILQD